MNTFHFKGSLHRSWCDLLASAQMAGLAPEMTYEDLRDRLGPDGIRPADPGSFGEIVNAYYRAGGDSSEVVRRRRDGYAAVYLGEPMNAMRWLARLIGSAPVLSGVTVERRPFASLRRGGRLERFVAEHGWAALADVVDAANSLLSSRTDERFVPLRATPYCEAYARLDLHHAEILAEVGLLEPDWEIAFAGQVQAQAA